MLAWRLSEGGSHEHRFLHLLESDGGVYGARLDALVFSNQALLAARSYSVAMLNSGQVDEFTVTTESGAVHVFRYWGGACADLSSPSP